MVYAWSIIYFTIKKLKFSGRRSKKTRDFEKKVSIRNFPKIAEIPKLLEI